MNEYVIGQEKAKKTLAVAVFNHYKRVRANMKRQYMLQQKHEREIAEGEAHAEHHHPSVPQDSYYAINPLPHNSDLSHTNPYGNFLSLLLIIYF